MAELFNVFYWIDDPRGNNLRLNVDIHGVPIFGKGGKPLSSDSADKGKEIIIATKIPDKNYRTIIDIPAYETSLSLIDGTITDRTTLLLEINVINPASLEEIMFYLDQNYKYLGLECVPHQIKLSDMKDGQYSLEIEKLKTAFEELMQELI